eukprot:CCRYP_020987-RB/>CCRYP_020987-RB protein AED:0.08 eAED:0.08 QI:64/1/1/1/0.5/0.33/3/984/172
MTTKISCAFFTLLLLSPCFTTARKSATIDPTLSRRRMAFLTGPLVDNSRTANKISTYENLGSRSSKMPSCCDASILSTRPLNRILNRIPVTSGSTRLFSLKPAALPLMDSVYSGTLMVFKQPRVLSQGISHLFVASFLSVSICSTQKNHSSGQMKLMELDKIMTGCRSTPLP